jgi:hypothetical protein
LIREALQHHQAGHLDEAEQLYRRALAIDPQNADCLHLLGMIAFQSGQLTRAAALIRQAIELHPAAASYHSNLGNVLQAEGNLDEAEACYRRALELKPGQAEVHLNLGHTLKAQGEVDSALASYRQALTLKPDMAEARVAESTALLLQGDFASGWQGFEFRWQTRDYDTPLRNYPQPMWRGEPLTSGRLLVWGEQGIGDEIMFAGVIPDLLRAGLPCVVDCDPRLQPLFARSFPRVEVLSGYHQDCDAALNIAAHLPSGSLPALLRASRESFAAAVPYLVAGPAQRGRFRDRYHDGRPRIGLAWHTTNRKSGRTRSIDLNLFAPLFSLPDLRWISLQYGDHGALEDEVLAAAAPLLIDREVDQLADIDTFAAQVASMDLVITIDNSTAHLAAALGVPTWLLLPFAPDWRWQQTGDRSPWYPSMRLFRQAARGDWPSVLHKVRQALLLGVKR